MLLRLNDKTYTLWKIQDQTIGWSDDCQSASSNLPWTTSDEIIFFSWNITSNNLSLVANDWNIRTIIANSCKLVLAHMFLAIACLCTMLWDPHCSHQQRSLQNYMYKFINWAKMHCYKNRMRQKQRKWARTNRTYIRVSNKTKTMSTERTRM